MSTDYYLVDDEGREVLDIGSGMGRWLFMALDNAEPITAGAVLAAAEADGRGDYLDVAAMARWLESHPSGPVWLRSEHYYEDGIPWYMPRPGEGWTVADLMDLTGVDDSLAALMESVQRQRPTSRVPEVLRVDRAGWGAE